ncbi:MAG: HD domain-containing protein [Firmicutes bacterium]|jgi:metal-dependent HD superfamily phosphatase/phosphodiesterase|nr:HD domain-containing protein [Bacillota bacterium]
MLTFEDIRRNPVFRTLIEKSNAYLRARGYTEHGMRHVTYVANTTAMILRELGYSERMVELGLITGYLHDVGNMHNRKHHGITGASIVYTELRMLGMDLEEICTITTAIANHEEEIGHAVTPMTAALIIADKSDAHRTRVHKKGEIGSSIHRRVNLAILDSKLSVDRASRTITFEIEFDQQSCQIMDYFEIYLRRMEMCKEAAELLGTRFRLVINGLELLGHLQDGLEPPLTGVS